MAGQPHRKKVTLALHEEDVARVQGSMMLKTGRGKFMDFPSAVYAMHPFDKVLVNGKPAGVSTWIGYSANEGAMLTLAILDAEFSAPGAQVTLVWGEENGGTAKSTVERHVQMEIGATVSPVPYAVTARMSYADSWRNRQNA